MTPLDIAHAAMAAAPEDDRARMGWYEALAAAELVVPIDDDTPGAEVRPQVIESEGMRFALAFDSEDRLAGFAGGPAPYAALPGRGLVAELARAGLGLGVNLTGESAFLMPPEAVAWLAELLAGAPEPVTARPDCVGPPHLPEALVSALDRRLARAAGLAGEALLVSAAWADGWEGHLLAVIGAADATHAALAQAVGEAVVFADAGAAGLAVMFLGTDDPFAERLRPHALRFDLAEPAAGPGTDPSRPPKLR